MEAFRKIMLYDKNLYMLVKWVKWVSVKTISVSSYPRNSIQNLCVKHIEGT